MSVEQNLRPREDGESLEDFRERISKVASSKKSGKPISKTPDKRPVDDWWESVGQKGLLEGYTGWERMEKAKSEESNGSAASYGSDIMSEAEGAGRFVDSLHKTIGKGITMDEVMAKIRGEVRIFEVRFGQFNNKGGFFNWCIDQMEEARNLTDKADELRLAS